MNYDGGSAFPALADNWRDGLGMSLRDWFAGQISAGMHANPDLMELLTAGPYSVEDGPERLAKAAYRYADAMLKQRASF